MDGKSVIQTLKEAFPFLGEIDLQAKEFGNPEFVFTAYADTFRTNSLMENESEAAGHENVWQDLYMTDAQGRMSGISVRRTTEKIHAPAYLSSGCSEEPPDDIRGESEDIGTVMDRQDMREASYIILHRRTRPSPRSISGKPTNMLIVAEVRKAEETAPNTGASGKPAKADAAIPKLDKLEIQAISEALRLANGNAAAAANLLEMTQKALRAKLRRFHINPEEFIRNEE